ncbi:EamA family transporter RarD [Phenylobacterium deserti]|uniref:EamA family transporter RarD n=1 Tax=Phenylobacterium deserti TaxID=1914756 RepID=A0A328ARS3_9CAUL|nr:EamA family transporter RarD [Phenylobacterium deserti]RAK57249.1 EamA family transporter RarD [Phenylobacterium deserti]
MASPPSAPGAEARLALTAGLLCYLIWGFVPLAFQAIGALGVGPWEILAHRTFWSIPLAGLFVLLARQGRQVVTALTTPGILLRLMLSSLLIAINWVTFIWAVNAGHVLETSLGYYINPLVNMAAGALLFRERIDRIGKIAMAIAAVGVIVQGFALGHLPIVSIILALSFGGYGIVRKQVAADAQTGLFVECLILGLPGIAFVAWLQAQGGGHFTQSPQTAAWLIASGPITALPLMLFAWAARRMPLSAMGFLQFLAPTISFCIGLSQGEPFTPLRALSFVFIWGGAAVFAWGAWRRSRSTALATAQAAPAE